MVVVGVRGVAVQTPGGGHSSQGRGLSGIPARVFGSGSDSGRKQLGFGTGTLRSMGGAWGSLTLLSALCVGCGLLLLSCLAC